MPEKHTAFTAGEFLDEAVDNGDIPEDGFEVVNTQSLYPFEWWILK